MSPIPALAAEMQAAASEIYLLDAASLQVVDANQAARLNLGLDAQDLQGRDFHALAPLLDRAELAALLASLGEEIGAQVGMRAHLRRADGSDYPVKLTFLRIVRDGHAMLLAVADDLTLIDAAAHALLESQARFDAVVRNTPGLVYQFVLYPDGRMAFPWLSEGCSALLGLSVLELQRDASLFERLILPEDRTGYLDCMQASRSTLSSWNWEGRIWIDAWKDVKWINLRATPHEVDGGVLQWDGIMTNITASKQEQHELVRSRARLAELTDHIEQLKEQERTRIAREIHDDLGGNLTAIKMALSMLAARLPGDQPALLEKANYLDDLVDRSIEAVHHISLDLRPTMLDLGIVAALEWQAREFEKQTGIACVFRYPRTTDDEEREPEIALDEDHATALFRIFQEALTNIAKHAGATRVRVALHRRRTHLTLAICDNGRGISPADRLKPHSFGLRGMSERAKALGGTMTLSAAPGGGTMVTIKIRLATPAPSEPSQPSQNE